MSAIPMPESVDEPASTSLSEAQCLALVRHFVIEKGRAPRLGPPVVDLHISNSVRKHFGTIQAMLTHAWTRDLMVAAGVNFIQTQGRLPAGPTNAPGTRPGQTEFWHAYGLPQQEPLLKTFGSFSDYQRAILEAAPNYGVHPQNREALLSYAANHPGDSLSDEQMRMNNWAPSQLLTTAEQGAVLRARNGGFEPLPLLQLAANDLSSPVAEIWRDAAKTIASIEQSPRHQRSFEAKTMSLSTARSLILEGQINGLLWNAPKGSLSCKPRDPNKPLAEAWTLGLQPGGKKVSVSVVQIFPWNGALLARAPWFRESITLDKAAKLIAGGAIVPVSENKIPMRRDTYPEKVVAHRILCAWGKAQVDAEPLELWGVKYEFLGVEASRTHKVPATSRVAPEIALA